MRKFIQKLREKKAINNERKRRALITWNGLVYFNSENTARAGNRDRLADCNGYSVSRPALMQEVIKARK